MKTAEKKPAWVVATEEKNKIKGLLLMLTNYPLDPTFLNYGNFYHKVIGREYHPDHRNAAKEKELNGFYKFSGNFYNVSFSFSIETNNKKDINKLIKAIEANKKSPEFKKAFLHNFNAIQFEKTVYLNKEEMGKGQFNDWFLTSYIGPVLHIDQISHAENELKKAIEEDKKTPPNTEDKEPEYRINYTERHYLNEEWPEILEICDMDGIKARQFSRITTKPASLNEYKEHTFKLTGRKILIKTYTYGILWIELKDNKPYFVD